MTNALLLNLPGAPDSPHLVDGIPGVFHPRVPVAVGEGHPITLERAQELDADPGCPLKLTTATADELTDGEQLNATVAAALKSAPASTKVDRSRATEQKAAAAATTTS